MKLTFRPPATQSKRLRLIIGPENQDWILGKFARKLQEFLPEHGFSCEIGTEPDPDAAVNYWLLFSEAWGAHFRAPGFYSGGYRIGSSESRHCVLVTHIDDSLKEKVTRELFDRGLDLAICLSRQTAEWLATKGLDRERLCFVVPGVDDSAGPRRVVIGITSRVYADGRKRESLLVDLAHRVRLDDFHFEIYGSGWERIVPVLETAGATVRYEGDSGDASRDYPVLAERVKHFDYYLYTGLDEGSMGTLDAWAAGVKTIVTPQGFHLDIPGGITHPFESAKELEAIVRRIARERQGLVARARERSWDRYAAEHAEIWRSRIEGNATPARYATRDGVPPDGILPDRGVRRRASFVLQSLRSNSLPTYRESLRFRLRGIYSRIKQAFVGGPAPTSAESADSCPPERAD